MLSRAGGNSYRIGVVADSHVGEFLARMPDAALDALAGSDLILHAGDLSVPSALDELEDVAPVLAVHGDHDRLDGRALPRSLVVTVGRHRVGMTHGHRIPLTDGAVIALDVIAGRRTGWSAGLARSLTRRVGPVDCIVFGHWHEPRTERVGGTLCFSPGAVCPWGSLEGRKHPRSGLAGIGDRGVRRYRWQLGPEAMRPRVGMLHVDARGVEATSIPLPMNAAADVAIPDEEVPN